MFSIYVDREIVLKVPTLKNAPKLFALVDRNRDFLQTYLPWVDHNVSVKDSEDYIKDSQKKYKREFGLNLCIFYKNQIVGTIGLVYIDKINKKCEIGYWLGEDFQGKGIMRRSCIALINYSIHVLKLHRIEIRCVAHNKKSQRIPEKLGFKKEGILRQSTILDREFFDMIVYGLLAQDPLPILQPTP